MDRTKIIFWFENTKALTLAVESHAIDRFHRIGQDKKVFAYRMICKNTVEEKILTLQNKKKKIAGDIIQTDESILKKLNQNDISELFS